MACKKLGSKPNTFKQQGQDWFCTTGLPSDVTVEVEEMFFHLHKFPLLSKSALLEKLIAENSTKEGCVVKLDDFPGGTKTFELVVKFCYGVKFELTASNVVYLRCAAELLQMTEEIAEENLIAQTEIFLNQIVFRHWKDSIQALQTCNNLLLPCAENFEIIKRCLDSLAVKACTDPNFFGWPMRERGAMQSPGGSVLWNGISTGARPKNLRYDWWYEDVSSLSLELYKRLISVMESRGIKQDIITGSLTFYAKRYLPGLNRRQNVGPLAITNAPSEEQKHLLEEIVSMLPFQKGVASAKFLLALLHTAMILRASQSCISNLEKRIGMELNQAKLEDLLLPTFSDSMETLYNVDCVQRILDHFLTMDQANEVASPGLFDDGQLIGSPSLSPITTLSKLIDEYLAEVAPDINLKLPKFQALAAALPDYARTLDDGLYRAIDIYLKAHRWLTEPEREQLCRLMDCQKLSLEACTHAAQNERLPLRTVVQVLFFEQLELRSSIIGCLQVSDNIDGSRPLRNGIGGSGEAGDWAITVRENQVLKVDMDSMRTRVAELENECTNMRQEIEKLGHMRSGWSSASKKFTFKLRPQMCSAREGSVSDQHKTGSSKNERVLTKPMKHKNQMPKPSSRPTVSM